MQANSACRGAGRLEIQRQTVDAVAQAGGRRAVVEDMAEMPAAAPAVDFGALHDECVVRSGSDRIRQGLPEARPACAGFEFRLGRIKGKIAARAMEGSGAVFIEERA